MASYVNVCVCVLARVLNINIIMSFGFCQALSGEATVAFYEKPRYQVTIALQNELTINESTMCF